MTKLAGFIDRESVEFVAHHMLVACKQLVALLAGKSEDEHEHVMAALHDVAWVPAIFDGVTKLLEPHRVVLKFVASPTLWPAFGLLRDEWRQAFDQFDRQLYPAWKSVKSTGVLKQLPATLLVAKLAKMANPTMKLESAQLSLAINLCRELAKICESDTDMSEILQKGSQQCFVPGQILHPSAPVRKRTRF